MMSRTLGLNIVFGVLFLSLLPVVFVIDTVAVEHFFSSQHLFEYAFDHAFRFGQDIIDNVGPYGYLHYPYTYAGGAFWSKMLWFACLLAIYAYYAVQLSTRIPNLYHKLLFLGTLSLFPLQIDCPWYAYEVIPRFAVLFSALYFLDPFLLGNDKKIHLPIIALFYAFLILEKASNVYFIFLVIALLTLYWSLARNWKNILYFLCAFFAGLITFWLAAAQPLSGLSIYFESMHTFIDAYQNVLPEKTSTPDLVYALIYCLSIALLIAHRIRFTPKNEGLIRSQNLRKTMRCKAKFVSPEGFRTILIAALCFLSWKHGIFRGANSYGTFLFTIPGLVVFLCLYPINFNMLSSWQRRIAGPSFRWGKLRYPYVPRGLCRGDLISVGLLLLIWTNVIYYNHEIHYPYNFYQQFYKRFSAIRDYHPQHQHQALAEKLVKLQKDNALPPSLKALIADSAVDEFGSTPEILLLNKLNYHPRPVPIQFIVGNQALNQKNYLYYQDPKTAPDIVFLPNFDFQFSDSLTYLTILLNYRFVSRFQHWFVMQKTPASQSIHFKKIVQSTVPLNQWIPVSNLPSSFLWANIDIKPSLPGKMKRFLYKPDLLYLDVEFSDGKQEHHAVSLAQLTSGFLLNPRPLAPNAPGEVNQWRSIKAFRISFEKPKIHIYFQPNMKVQFSQVIIG